MKSVKALIVCLVLVVILLNLKECIGEGYDLTPDTIIRRVAENTRSVKNEDVKIQVVLEKAKGRKHTKEEFTVRYLASYEGRLNDKIRIDVVSGDRVGEKVLQIGRKYWRYDPKRKGNELQSLADEPEYERIFGTNFRWLDLRIMESEDWIFERDAGDIPIYWYIKATPKKKGEYQFLRVTLRPDFYFPLEVEYFNKSGEVIKNLLVAHDILDGPRPREMIMEDSGGKVKTTLIFLDRRLPKEIPNEIFNPEKLATDLPSTF